MGWLLGGWTGQQQGHMESLLLGDSVDSCCKPLLTDPLHPGQTLRTLLEAPRCNVFGAGTEAVSVSALSRCLTQAGSD